MRTSIKPLTPGLSFIRRRMGRKADKDQVKVLCAQCSIWEMTAPIGIYHKIPYETPLTSTKLRRSWQRLQPRSQLGISPEPFLTRKHCKRSSTPTQKVMCGTSMTKVTSLPWTKPMNQSGHHRLVHQGGGHLFPQLVLQRSRPKLLYCLRSFPKLDK